MSEPYDTAMNGQMRLERVTKRTYRLTGFRRISTVEAARRIGFGRSLGATRGDYTGSAQPEARQLPDGRRLAP